MRSWPVIWFALACVCGAILFQTSQRVNDGRQKLAQIEGNIRKEDQSIRVLQAEWSYLNQPERLEKLTKKYLGLQPLKGSQFTDAAQLETRPVEMPAAETAAPAVAAAQTPAVQTPAPEKIDAPKTDTPKTEVAKAPAAKPVLKPAAQKTAEKKPAQKPVFVWREPPRTAPAARPAPVQESRNFSDVINSLGVR